MIDIGANLTDRSFRDDLNDVLQRAKTSGIEHIIVTGTDLKHSRHAIDLCGLFPDYLSSTVGVHPHNASSVNAKTIRELKRLAGHDCVVAIGETGLDYYREFSPRRDQQAAFEMQLQLAQELNMPAFIHDRNSKGDLLQALSNYPRLRGVIHCFTGTEQLLKQYLQQDLYIGITGWICDERRGLELQKAVRCIPDERILIETDAPYLLPRTIKPRSKSRRNEPGNLIHVAKMIADCRSQSLEEIQQFATANAKALFRLD